MRRSIARLFAVAAALVVAGGWFTVLRPAGPAAAQGAGSLPGMCSGRSDPNLVITAHANGRPGDVEKFILNVSTDPSGQPSGSLAAYRGPDHLTVSDFCRVWQHLPGQPMGECGEVYPVGAVTAHAVGIGTMGGTTMLVRADVRKLSDGQVLFRFRYRPWSPGESVTAAGGGCEDAGWTWYPGEDQWAPLDQLRVSPAPAPV